MKNIRISSLAAECLRRHFFSVITLKLLLVSILLCGMSGMSYSQDLVKRIKAINEKNGTMLAPFTETEVMVRTKKETKKSGNLWFEAPGSLLMRYDDPAGDVTLIHDGKFTVRRSGKVQSFAMRETKDPTDMQILRSTLLYSFQGDVANVAKINGAKIESKESTTRLRFIITKRTAPDHNGVNSIDLLYDKVTGALLQMKLIKVNGNYTLYETTKPKIKQIFPKEIWVM